MSRCLDPYRWSGGRGGPSAGFGSHVIALSVSPMARSRYPDGHEKSLNATTGRGSRRASAATAAKRIATRRIHRRRRVRSGVDGNPSPVESLRRGAPDVGPAREVDVHVAVGEGGGELLRGGQP